MSSSCVIIIPSLIHENFLNTNKRNKKTPWTHFVTTILPIKTLSYDNEVKLNEEIPVKAKPIPKQLDINILDKIQELEKSVSSNSSETIEIKTKPVKAPAPVITSECNTKKLLKIMIRTT